MKPGFFRFKKSKRGYLITNDFGRFRHLTAHEFKAFTEGTLNEKSELYAGLAKDLFVQDTFGSQEAAEWYHERYHYLHVGPSLHIVVITLRCNYKCVYCQANRRDSGSAEFDMTKATAKNVVDRIFESPSNRITIEFQGGEPLLNWPVVKFVIEYAKEKNAVAKKDMRTSMVTNLSLMTDEIYDFLVKHNVSLCTSVDGPPELHNKNRPCLQMNSYKATTDWVKKIRKIESRRTAQEKLVYPHKLNALVTITRNSLKNMKGLIDEYVKYDFTLIHLRRLSLLGFSGGAAREVIGYTAEEFIKAWKEAMDYIIKLNLKGTVFGERGTLIFLQKMLQPVDSGYLDIRSPCGAAVGQLAYNYNGKVYTCDEARTLEDDTFLLGDVNKGDYQRVIASPKTKTMLLASTLENFACDECVYKTYCGTCPVLNYVLHGTIFPQIRSTDMCKIHIAMLDYIFEKMQDKKIADIFNMWVRSKF